MNTGSSDRQFGLVVGAILAAVAAWPVLRGGSLRIVPLAVGFALIAAGALSPRLLKPVNRFWQRLGMALGKVTNPVVAGLLFVVVITPLGLLLRKTGRLSVVSAMDPFAPSYWQEKSNPASAAERMRFQF